MKKWLAVLMLLLICAPLLRAQFGSFGDAPIEIDAESTRFEGGVAIAEGNVVVHYSDATLYCDYAEYNPETRDVLVRGNVRIYRAGRLFVGERAVYNLETKQLRAADFRGDFYPFKFSGDTLSSLGGNSFQVGNATFTTSDSSKPDYHIRARSVRIYPNDRIVFSNVTLFVGRTPVFWWPYLFQSLKRDTSFSFTPGYRSAWGGFLLTQYTFPITETWAGRLHLDLRTRRGAAIGFDSDFTYGKDNRSWGRFRSYYASDLEPGVNKTSLTREPIDPNRYRVSLQHRLYITDDIYANIDLNKLSDRRVLEDFFPNEFRVEPQPDNVVGVTKWHENYTASLIYRKQINNFFGMTERLPEFVVDFKRQSLFNLPIFYEGETSVAWLRRNFAKGQGFDDYGTVRVDSFHELMVPQVIGGWLSVIPRIGARGTYYGESGYFEAQEFGAEPTLETLIPRADERREPVQEYRLNSGSAIWRGVVNLGVEASFKLSREWNHIATRAWGLDGLRHILQPYTDISVAYSNQDPERILQFDRYNPSTQLPLFDFPQFTGVDSIDDWAIWRLGMRNRLQTRRDNNTINWLEIDTYFNINLEVPDFPAANFREGRLSNLYNRIRWNPVPWVALGIAAQTPLVSQGFTEINSELNFFVNQNLRLDLGHRYIDNNPFFQNSSLVHVGGYLRINDNWGFSFREQYEASDGVLESQSYQIHRDLSSWVASLGVIVRDNGGENEYGVLLTFTLKDLPAISLPINLDPQGQGIAGKNK